MSLTAVTVGFAAFVGVVEVLRDMARVLFEVAQLAMAQPSGRARSSFSTLRIMVTKNRSPPDRHLPPEKTEGFRS